MSRRVNTVVLCEDSQQESFICRFLKKYGGRFNRVRVEKSPKGRGSGEQFVRERYVRELSYYRSRKCRVGQLLIVVVDADKIGVEGRIGQIEQTVIDAGYKPREKDEHVVFVVPARNIETWFKFLDGETVNETDTYHKLAKESDCQAHVNQLYEYCTTGNLPMSPPESLVIACREFHQRLNDILC